MTDTTKAQILEVARKAIHTEMLSLKRMEDTLGDEFATAVEMILGSRGKCIVTGMGKSGLVGRKIAATLASTGTPSFFLHPGEAFHGDLGMISKEDIVVALSYSGETDEILKIVPFIHSNGNKLVSMTGNPDSALAKNSDVHLDVGVKEEACILHLAPTSSTTAQIAMGDALAVSLMQMRGFTSVDFARLHPGGSLGRRLLMTVGNVMRDHDLPVVAPDCPAAEMIHAISKGGLGLIVICEGERIEGIVTDGDVRRAMERLRGEFFNIRASDIATRNPKTISPDEKLIEAEKMMTRNKVTSLLVTDRSDPDLRHQVVAMLPVSDRFRKTRGGFQKTSPRLFISLCSAAFRPAAPSRFPPARGFRRAPSTPSGRSSCARPAFRWCRRSCLPMRACGGSFRATVRCGSRTGSGRSGRRVGRRSHAPFRSCRGSRLRCRTP